MKSYIINGTYGTGTPCQVLCVETSRGTWYCVEGSKNVNFTNDLELPEGVDVEQVTDTDTFTAANEVNSLTDLVNEVDYDFVYGD